MVDLLNIGTPGSSERSLTPSTGDVALDNAAVILTALRKISSMSGVPFIREAATVAVRIVNLIKDVRDNNDGFRLLSIEAGKLVWTIANECERLAQAGKSVPTSVQEHIRALITNLHAIEEFVEGKMLRRKLYKIMSYATDKTEVTRYRDLLRNALDQFAIQTSIASQEALYHITETIDNHRVEVVFDRIHQTDALNRLMQHQADQIEQLRQTVVSRNEDDRLRDDREYWARVEREQAASQQALHEEQQMRAEEERLRNEQEKKNAEQAALRKQASEKLKQYDKEQAERAEKAEAKKRREQEREERETRQAIAIVEMQQRKEAKRQDVLSHKKRQEELERQRQEEEEALAAKKAAADKKEARVAAQEAEDAHRRQQRKTGKQRRDEEEKDDDDEEEYEEAPRRRPNPGTHITATQVEITLTRKKNGGSTATTKKAQKSSGGNKDRTAHHTHAKAAFDGEKFARDLERQIEREFEGFEDEFAESSDDSDEYWSDDALPRKGRAKAKKSVKASARAGRARSYVGVDSLGAGIRDMAMHRVHAQIEAHSPYYPPHHHGSPYMMPPPGPYSYDYPTSPNHANATSISVSNISNSAISFGDTPAIVRNSGNVRVVNISNVGNRY